MKAKALFIARAIASAPAGATECLKSMKKIDDALPSARLDAKKMEQVRKLRAACESLHRAGNHADAQRQLGNARDLLDIRQPAGARQALPQRITISGQVRPGKSRLSSRERVQAYIPLRAGPHARAQSELDKETTA